jgi:hypothetical protein
MIVRRNITSIILFHLYFINPAGCLWADTRLRPSDGFVYLFIRLSVILPVYAENC